MTDKHERNGPLSFLTTGVAEIPRNAAWLASKMVPRSTNGSGPVAGLGDSARSAGAAVKAALPGQDSVDARLARARAAAEQARAAEHDALTSAERAQELAQQAEATDRDEQQRLEEVRKDQDRVVGERTAEARRRADEMVAQEEAAARQEAERVLEDERRTSAGRVQEARERAEKAQAAAEETYRQATEQLAEARSRAEEAAAAAADAAERARAEAEHIAAQAHEDAADAQEAVAAADELRSETATTAAAVTRTVKDRSLPGDLGSLTKAELLDLAAAHGIEGRSSKNKKQLVAALDRKARTTEARR